MAMNATTKFALTAGRGPFVWILTITPDTEIPANSVPIYLSDKAYASDEGGASSSSIQTDPRVLSWGGIRYAWSDRGGNIDSVETEVVIADSDRLYSKYIESAAGYSLRRAAAVISLAHPDTSDWEPMFTGIIDGWDYPSQDTLRFTLRVDDLALRQSVPGEHWRITPYDWKNAPSASWNKYAPIIFGEWNQIDYGGKGAVPLTLVDPTNDIWLVSAGRCRAVNRVYVNGTVSSNWTKQYLTKGGKYFTAAQWSSTPPADDATVTADVEGYEYIGDGTGDLIETPVDQMVYFLSNFVFSRYRSGLWLSANSRIDLTAAEILGDFLDQRGYRGARRIEGDTTGYDELALWHQSHEIRSCWNRLGQLSWGVDAWDVDYYDAAAVDISRQERDFRIEVEREQVLSAMTMNYLQNSAENEFQNSISVADRRVVETAEEVTNQLWGIAS